MHFYELHEGDDDVFADLLLARDEEMDAEEFFELVQSIRRRVVDSFEQDTLVEAIADELELNYGFITITDERLTSSAPAMSTAGSVYIDAMLLQDIENSHTLVNVKYLCAFYRIHGYFHAVAYVLS